MNLFDSFIQLATTSLGPSLSPFNNPLILLLNIYIQKLNKIQIVKNMVFTMKYFSTLQKINKMVHSPIKILSQLLCKIFLYRSLIIITTTTTMVIYTTTTEKAQVDGPILFS